MNIEKKALELLVLRQQSTTMHRVEDIDQWLVNMQQQFALTAELQKARLRKSVIKVNDSEAARVLSEIGTGDIEDPADVDESLFYESFDPKSYVLGLARVDSFISTIAVPSRLRTFIDEARQCYALGQYCAVYALSRTILEAAITDICVHVGFIPHDVDPKRLIKEFSPFKRIERLATGTLKVRIKNLYYDKTSVLIHGGKIAHGSEAVDAFTESLALVHLLYRQHVSDLIKEQRDSHGLL